jgi:aminopeptidase-like protein
VNWDSADHVGAAAHALARRLWPIHRSISGAGLRQTLRIIQELLPGLELVDVPSGAEVLDWIVPDEWEITEAWLEDPSGHRIADVAASNLHVLGYSTAVDATMDLATLQAHLHSIPEQPDAIPYVTSFYGRTWGFCLADRVRQALPEGQYRALIRARHFPGSITYGELVIPGAGESEVLVSTYCCHPSMANNELSGPCLAVYLASYLQMLPQRQHTYRFVFLPEMIGSAAYLHRHRTALKQRVIAGFNISCVGDDRAWSWLPSRHGATLADRLAQHVLNHAVKEYRRYSWSERGSDESNYCAPGIDLPVTSVMRSKYGTYPEYHTSLDDLEQVVTPAGLAGAFTVYRRFFEYLEQHCYPVAQVLGEPQLGRRGLYPSVSKKGSSAPVRRLLDVLSMADGTHSLLDAAESCGIPVWELYEPLRVLQAHGLVDVQRAAAG